MKRFLCIALLLLLPSMAYAADLGRERTDDSRDYLLTTLWTGAYVSADFGTAISVETLDVSHGTYAGQLDGLGAYGFLGVLGAGVDYHIPATKVVLGAYGNYALGDQEFRATANDFLLSAKLQNEWSVGGRFGYLLTPAILTYGKVGYASADLNVSSTADLHLKSSTLSGLQVGTGIELSLGGGWYANSEYTFTGYGSESVYSSERTNVSIAPDEHRVLAGVKYKFGSMGLNGPLK